MKKVLHQVSFSKRWSSFSSHSTAKKSVPCSDSSTSSEMASFMPTYGVSFGSASAQGKFHKNEDFVVESISLGDCISSLSQRFSTIGHEDSESKMDEGHHDTLSIDDMYFTAIFDGHGGQDCAKYMAAALPANLAELVAERQFKTFQDFCSSSTVSEAFHRCENDFMQSYEHSGSGSCVMATVVHGNSFLLAWLGDCRAVLFSGDKVLPLSRDHRTSNQEEFDRIVQSGGQVTNGRVMGLLSPTRAFGDNDIKRTFPGVVSAEPTVLSFAIDEAAVPSDISFLMIASDGVFDAFTNDRVCDIVEKSLSRSNDPQEAAKRLIEAAGRANYDDVSATVIVWNHKQRKARSQNRIPAIQPLQAQT